MERIGGIHGVENAVFILADVVDPHQIGVTAFLLIGSQRGKFLVPMLPGLRQDFERDTLMRGLVFGKEHRTECARTAFLDKPAAAEVVARFIHPVSALRPRYCIGR